LILSWILTELIIPIQIVTYFEKGLERQLFDWTSIESFELFV
jgi:hypothetical protein